MNVSLANDSLAFPLVAIAALCLSASAHGQAPPDDPGPTAWSGYLEADVQGATAELGDLDLSLSLDPDRGQADTSVGAATSDWFAADSQDLSSELGAPIDYSYNVSLAMMHDVDPKKPVAGHANLAEAATNPVAPLIQLQVQNTSNFKTPNASGYGNTFVVQPVIPWKIGSQQFISRITFPLLVATADPDGPLGRQYGVGDTVAINFANFPIKNDFWGGTLALGVGLTFPTASSDFLGEGKYQAGPGVFYINTSTKGIQWGFLIYQQWSYASAGGDSDRTEVSKLFGQPLFNYHFGEGWYTGLGDILWSIDWRDDNQWKLPLSARLGKVTKLGHQPVNIFIEPFYDVTSPDSGGAEWGIKLSFTMLFPE